MTLALLEPKELFNLPDYKLELVLDELEREKCRTDLYYLAHTILGYADLTESIHRPLCDIIQSVNPLIAILKEERERQYAPKPPAHVTEHEHNLAEWHLKYPQHNIDKSSTTSLTSTNDNLLISMPPSPTDGATVERNGGRVGGAQDYSLHSQNSIKISDKPIGSPNVAGANRSSEKSMEASGSYTNLIAQLRFKAPRSMKHLEQYVTFREDSKTRLFLMFRGSFKSTLITIAHTIQLMIIWPDIRILIASHKKEGGSQKFLQSIKDHFIRNERFRKLFPEWCPKANANGQIEWGTSEQVTLPNRSKTAIFPEATIEIAGATTDVTGRHYNVLKVDDLVTRESVTNEQMLERTEEFNALLKFLFDQPEWGLMDYAGTSYHFADIYQKLRESNITKVILPCWDHDEHPTIPERFTRDGLEAIKNDASMTSYQFSAQYLLNPVPKEDQKFRPEYFNGPDFYYDKLPDNLKVYVLVDPASTQRKESDYTALITIGIDSKGDLYLIDIIRDKLTQDGRAELVYKMLRKNQMHIVHYESISFQSSDHKAIKDKGYSNGWYITVSEIKASKISKDDRIAGLQYFYEQGKVHWPRSYKYHSKYLNKTLDMIDILRKELMMFPNTQFKDLSDCHSFILRSEMLKASAYVQQESTQTEFDWYRQQAIEAKKRSYSPFNGAKNMLSQIPFRKSWR